MPVPAAAAYIGAMRHRSLIIEQILADFPRTQAIYLFGSAATGETRPGSDIDIAVLLPPDQAMQAGSLGGSPLQLDLEDELSRDVDLINLRQSSTVMQKEVIGSGERLYCSDENSADEFEMHVLSLYQKLNDERAAIVADGLASGRFLES